jgi:hypothetical protein
MVLLHSRQHRATKQRDHALGATGLLSWYANGESVAQGPQLHHTESTLAVMRKMTIAVLGTKRLIFLRQATIRQEDLLNPSWPTSVFRFHRSRCRGTDSVGLTTQYTRDRRLQRLTVMLSHEDGCALSCQGTLLKTRDVCAVVGELAKLISLVDANLASPRSAIGNDIVQMGMALLIGEYVDKSRFD